MNKQRGFLRTFFLMAVSGAMILFSMLDRPSLANIRTVDVVRLVGTGMLFGGAIFSLAAYFFGDRFMKD